jgi:hypothetical protein
MIVGRKPSRHELRARTSSTLGVLSVTATAQRNTRQSGASLKILSALPYGAAVLRQEREQAHMLLACSRHQRPASNSSPAAWNRVRIKPSLLAGLTRQSNLFATSV